MKRLRAGITATLLICTLLFTGCNRPDYTEEEKTKIEEDAKELTQEYFDSILEKKSLLSANIQHEYRSSNNFDDYSLTSGMLGSYRNEEDGQTYNYLYDIDGKIFYSDEKNEEVIKEIVEDIESDIGIKDNGIIKNYSYEFKNQKIDVVGYTKARTLNTKDTIVEFGNGLLLDYSKTKDELVNELEKDLKQIISPEEKEELQIDDDERFVLNLTIEVDSIDTSIIKDDYKEWNNVNIIIKCPNGELKLYTNYDEEKNHTETNAEEKTNDNNK